MASATSHWDRPHRTAAGEGLARCTREVGGWDPVVLLLLCLLLRLALLPLEQRHHRKSRHHPALYGVVHVALDLVRSIEHLEEHRVQEPLHLDPLTRRQILAVLVPQRLEAL